MEYASIVPKRSTKDHPLTVIDRFPITTAARTAKTGLAIGLAYGLAQDAVAAAKGRRLGYVDFLLRQSRKSAKADTKNEIP